MRRSLFRALLLFVPLLAAAALLGRVAAACERCRTSGTTAFHIPPVGGDDSADTVTPLPLDDGPGVGHFLASSSKWPQPGGLGSPVTVTYSYQNMFDGGLRGPGAVPGPNGVFLPDGPPLPNSLIRDSIEEAFGLWASVAPLTFVEVPDDGLPYGQSTQFGQIRIQHRYINGPDPPPPANPIAKAQAYYPSGAGAGLPGDVQFDHGDPWQEFGTIPIPDILGAMIHELGHSLGLGHTTVPDANMYWIFTRSNGLGTGALHPDDIAGIQYIYGAGSGGVFPLDLPIPEPATSLLILFAGISWLAGSRPRLLIEKSRLTVAGRPASSPGRQPDA